MQKHLTAPRDRPARKGSGGASFGVAMLGVLAVVGAGCESKVIPEPAIPAPERRVPLHVLIGKCADVRSMAAVQLADEVAFMDEGPEGADVDAYEWWALEGAPRSLDERSVERFLTLKVPEQAVSKTQRAPWTDGKRVDLAFFDARRRPLFVATIDSHVPESVRLHRVEWSRTGFVGFKRTRRCYVEVEDPEVGLAFFAFAIELLQAEKALR